MKILTIKEIKQNLKNPVSHRFIVACKMSLDIGRTSNKNNVTKNEWQGFLVDSTGWLEILVTDKSYKKIASNILKEDILDMPGYAKVRLIDSNKLIFSLTDFALSETLNVNDIYEAIENNDLKLVKKLIKQGTDIEARGYIDRATPLMVAIHHKNKPIIEELIKAGADLKAKDTAERTPLSLMEELF